ncbi:MAG: hypothetical protein KH046_19230, partial [Stenotrophomonas maltophilia]|nr:hypothetical protein [Stenotrophomonas maltophilia]
RALTHFRGILRSSTHDSILSSDGASGKAGAVQEVGLQWSMLTCLQYLSGKEALGALKALPNDWSERGRTKQHLQGASILAAHAVANMRQDGRMLCASDFAHEFKGKTVEQWLAEASIGAASGTGPSV